MSYISNAITHKFKGIIIPVYINRKINIENIEECLSYKFDVEKVPGKTFDTMWLTKIRQKSDAILLFVSDLPRNVVGPSVVRLTHRFPTMDLRFRLNTKTFHELGINCFSRLSHGPRPSYSLFWLLIFSWTNLNFDPGNAGIGRNSSLTDEYVCTDL
jgi:hypothetical protein